MRSKLMGRADKVMLDSIAEEKGKTVGIHAPHRGADPQGRALPRDDFEPHRRAILSRWLVLTLAPKGLMSSDRNKKRLDPA